MGTRKYIARRQVVRSTPSHYYNSLSLSLIVRPEDFVRGLKRAETGHSIVRHLNNVSRDDLYIRRRYETRARISNANEAPGAEAPLACISPPLGGSI